MHTLVVEPLLTHLVKALGATRDGDIGENKWRLPLETRYYTATLCISITECLSVDDANLNSLSESPEALVFVNPSQETKDLLSKLDDMPPITLVLHNGDDSTTTNQWKEFCLEREIECILVKNANATDEEDSETTGWARVKEALECHMWPDLKLLRESDKTQLYDVSTDPSLTLPQMDKVEAMRERLFGHSKHDAEELNSFGLDDEDDGLERAFETMSSLKSMIVMCWVYFSPLSHVH